MSKTSTNKCELKRSNLNLISSVKIALSTSSNIELFFLMVQKIKKDFPSLDVQISKIKADKKKQAIKNKTHDILFMLNPDQPIPNELAWEPVIDERFYIITPLGMSEKDPKKLFTENKYIKYLDDKFKCNALERCCLSEKILLNTSMELGTEYACLNMVKHALGITILALSKQKGKELSVDFNVVPLNSSRQRITTGFLYFNSPASKLIVQELMSVL